jgi:hypothetical protein
MKNLLGKSNKNINNPKAIINFTIASKLSETFPFDSAFQQPKHPKVFKQGSIVPAESFGF